MPFSSNIAAEWGGLDFVVHAIAFSDKNELKGRYADTTRENFTRTMLISCFSFTEIARRAARLMKAGGALLTLTYDGSNRVMPNYNVMGVAKAALEASVRYLAADFGPAGIRVNAISAGPVRTLAGAGIADARLMFNFQKRHAPLRRSVSIEEIGNAGPLPALRSVERRHGRDPLRGFRLQHRLDAASRSLEDRGRGGNGGRIVIRQKRRLRKPRLFRRPLAHTFAGEASSALAKRVNIKRAFRSRRDTSGSRKAKRETILV